MNPESEDHGLILISRLGRENAEIWNPVYRGIFLGIISPKFEKFYKEIMRKIDVDSYFLGNTEKISKNGSELNFNFILSTCCLIEFKYSIESYVNSNNKVEKNIQDW